MESYYRVTYNDVGIYEALKRQIWNNNSNFTKEDWTIFKNSDKVNWLEVPSIYGNYYFSSFFTEKGFSIFKKKTYPLIIKWLDENQIQIRKYLFDIGRLKIVYQDEYQIVLENLEKKEETIFVQ